MVARRLLLAAFAALLVAGAVATTAQAQTEAAPPPPAGLKVAIFAGGCFWCMVHPFDQLDGVREVLSGYTGGVAQNPTYQQVSSGGTQHRESVRIVFDPAKVSYERLLEVFARNIDPLDAGGQFCDRGMQYTPAIFFTDADQRQAAEQWRREMVQRFGPRIAVAVMPAGPFYVAEAYHQDYYKKNPVKYKFYRYSCGRDARLDEVWKGEARDGQPRPGLF